MTTTRTRFIRAAAAIGGLSAAGAILLPGVAAADPGPAGPLLNSTCSFAQIDGAQHNVAPQIAQHLDENPDRKARLQQLFALPIDQRQQAVDTFLDNHPRAKEFRDQAQSGPHADQIRQQVQEIANTCQNY